MERVIFGRGRQVKVEGYIFFPLTTLHAMVREHVVTVKEMDVIRLTFWHTLPCIKDILLK